MIPAALRERAAQRNLAPPRRGDYVLYLPRANRRAESNHALEFAAGLANELDVPLVCYESLRCDEPYASLRFHTFVLEGVPEMERRIRARGAGYVFHLQRRRADPDEGFHSAAARAAAVVTDDHPLLPWDGGATLAAPLWTVEASCIVPIERIGKREWAAYTLRPKIRKLLPRYLEPVAPVRLRRRFRGALPAPHTKVAAAKVEALAGSCEIDRDVAPSPRFRGGRAAADETLRRFLRERLRRYAREKNDPARHATSELSAYLHIGHIGALETALAVRSYAGRHKLMAGEFLEELTVRRELAFNFCRYAEDVRTLDALPEWARRTLGRHARDRREHVYSAAAFEQGRTHDRLWNACQKELLATGRIHGYYRMYWGKKIIEWSAGPEEALDTAIHLNDRWALDGRDPNSYANILWWFGLHDRPWPERPVFGTVRWMSLEGMRRKTDVDAYLREIEALP